MTLEPNTLGLGNHSITDPPYPALPILPLALQVPIHTLHSISTSFFQFPILPTWALVWLCSVPGITPALCASGEHLKPA